MSSRARACGAAQHQPGPPGTRGPATRSFDIKALREAPRSARLQVSARDLAEHEVSSIAIEPAVVEDSQREAAPESIRPSEKGAAVVSGQRDPGVFGVEAGQLLDTDQSIGLR